MTLDTIIVWFRRDLRLYDNPALVAALNSAKCVIPVYVWAPEEEGQFQPGRQTRWWNKHSVLCLSQRLQQLGSRLVVRRARESVQALKDIVQETGAQAVFFNHLYDAISMVRDQQVKDELRAQGVLTSSFNADLLYEPWEVLDEGQQPYTTFKAYWDRCLAMPYAPPLPLPEPSGPLPPVPDSISSCVIREVDWFMSAEQEASTEALTHRWDPSGQAAVARLEAFLEQGLPSFQHDRAKTDRESTTMLSPWIHFGTISVRHIYYRVAQKHAEWQAGGVDRGTSCLDFLQQMGYREYSRYLAFHFPFITERSMLAHLRAVPWRLDQDAFKAWRQGLTGYPLVDAGMRQLWSMGWCHNRVRVVASHFLVKHLLLPWQWGLKHLWDCQIDADLECDALGWQYVSGCLSDAHPFSYMVDLEQEWKRFDPDGHYVRRWLPVLSQLPPQYIHQPWKAPPEVLEEAGVELGFNYPWPIITAEAAKEGVAWASAVVERCATSSSGSSGSSSGTALNSLMPRKEPYRPPTDPALMSSFLAAAAAKGGGSWQQRLPALYIHAASGHPLSLHHTAQQRPHWGLGGLGGFAAAGAGAGVGGGKGYCGSASVSSSGSGSDGRGLVDRWGRHYKLRRGAMGQQQLMLTDSPEGSDSMPDAAAAADVGAVSSSGSDTPSQQQVSEDGDSSAPAAAPGGAAGGAALGQQYAAGAIAVAAAGGIAKGQQQQYGAAAGAGVGAAGEGGDDVMLTEEEGESPAPQQQQQQQRARMPGAQAVGAQGAAAAVAVSEEEQVVPSLCVGANAAAAGHGVDGAAAGGVNKQQRQQQHGSSAHARRGQRQQQQQQQHAAAAAGKKQQQQLPRGKEALTRLSDGCDDDAAMTDDAAATTNDYGADMAVDDMRPRAYYEMSDSWGFGGVGGLGGPRPAASISTACSAFGGAPPPSQPKARAYAQVYEVRGPAAAGGAGGAVEEEGLAEGGGDVDMGQEGVALVREAARLQIQPQQGW